MGFDLGEMLTWVCGQLAIDQARLTDVGHSNRLGSADRADLLEQINEDRRHIQMMTPAEVRVFAARYAARPGYLHEWRLVGV